MFLIMMSQMTVLLLSAGMDGSGALMNTSVARPHLPPPPLMFLLSLPRLLVTALMVAASVHGKLMFHLYALLVTQTAQSQEHLAASMNVLTWPTTLDRVVVVRPLD